MLFSDVNVLVHAIQPDQSPESPAVSEWLDSRLDGPESLGISEFVLSSMTRIVTQPRLYNIPNTPEQCMEFAEALLAAPAVQVVRPGPRHWTIFRELVTTYRLRGNDVPDAYLASLAMEHGATFVTLDRGFARFEGLRTLNPLAT
jgi:toxin-antitoxin system PIN domain toxin